MQPDKSARREYGNIEFDIPEAVAIPGTKRVVSITCVKPYTIECLTRLWLKREALMEDDKETLRSLCREPYFALKEALLFVLNSYWKIRLLLPLKLWIWKVRGYTEEQVSPIIQAGKKKLPLMAHWTNMAFSVDMRTDWKNLTKKEAEQYRAELLQAAERLSSRNTQSTEKPEGSSSDS